jgi:hypothetical protein
MGIPGWLKTVAQIAPAILAFTPAAPLAPWVALGIHTAEGIDGATGPQKLEIAKAIAKVGVAAVNAQAGKELVDVTSSDVVITDGINAVVAATNLKHKDASK